MHEVKLELEAVTPIFIAGADQRNIEYEGLRPQSLRGLMRWWFRAIVGGIMWDTGNLDLSKLSEFENEIFGNQKKKSAVAIITQGSGIFEEFNSRSFSQPVNYFFFSMKGTRGPPPTPPRKYLKEDSRFKINLKGKEQPVNTSLIALWLLINLGGVGSRSRRFGGQLREISNLVQNIDQGLSISFAPKKGESYEIFLKNNIQSIQKYLSKQIEASSSNNFSSSPPFPMIARNYFSILTKKHQAISSWKDVINEFGNAWSGAFNPQQKRVVGGIRKQLADSKFSQQIKENLSSPRNFLPRQCNEKRPFIGLPLNYFFMDLRPPKGIELTAQGQVEYTRRASPISFGLTNVDGEFYSRVVIFKSEFLPEAPVEWKLSKLNKTIQPPPTSDMNKILSKVESDLCAAGWSKVRMI